MYLATFLKGCARMLLGQREHQINVVIRNALANGQKIGQHIFSNTSKQKKIGSMFHFCSCQNSSRLFGRQRIFQFCLKRREKGKKCEFCSFCSLQIEIQLVMLKSDLAQSFEVVTFWIQPQVFKLDAEHHKRIQVQFSNCVSSED